MASGASVCGSSIASTGRSMPTQTVMIRPALSKVIEPHSRTKKADVVVVPLPSGPMRR